VRIRLAALLVVSSTLMASPRARAGEAASESRFVIEQESPIALAATVKAEFAAGTAASAFASLEQPFGGRIQFVVHPSAREIPLPAVAVRHTTVLGVIDLLGKLAPDLRIRIHVGAQLIPTNEMLTSYLDDPKAWRETYRAPEETIVGLVDLAPSDEQGKELDRRLRVYRVGNFLSNAITMDDLATAIDTVWQLDSASRAATLKVHKETSLLICSGSARHLQLAEEVIEQLSGAAPTPSQAAREGELEEALKKAWADAEAAHAAHSAVVANLKGQLAGLQSRISELEKAAAKAQTTAPVGR
jgi:hypothetical protein